MRKLQAFESCYTTDYTMPKLEGTRMPMIINVWKN